MKFVPLMLNLPPVSFDGTIEIVSVRISSALTPGSFMNRRNNDDRIIFYVIGIKTAFFPIDDFRYPDAIYIFFFSAFTATAKD
jgi:hypothetical protein